MARFKEDLAVKRDMRKKRLGEVADELKGLRDQLQQEVDRRHELETQLSHLRSEVGSVGDESGASSDGNKLSKEVEALRISRYDQDDDDEIDILDEEEEDKVPRQQESDDKKKKKKGKKRVSFSLELVKEEEGRQPGLETAPTPSDAETVTDAHKEQPEKETTAETDGQQDQLTRLTLQNKKFENQIRALKDVANLSKQLLALRESQVTTIPINLHLCFFWTTGHIFVIYFFISRVELRLRVRFF